MNPSRFRELDKVFTTALQLRGDARCSFLDDACPGDPDLRGDVESLLAIEESLPEAFADSVIERRVMQWAHDFVACDTTAMPQRIGPYEVVELIGAGAMGIVYRAIQPSPRRFVALKVLLAHLAATPMRRRFEQEADLLARLRHPHIAQVIESGVADIPVVRDPSGEPEHVGVPFMAIELVEGAAITHHVRAHKLDVGARMSLLAQICRAMGHAHQRGVIHRDLKPGNVLVTDAGDPRIVDFGIACLEESSDARGEDARTRTMAGHVMGTLAYMSPEQLAADGSRVDARADVYSLGMIGYELLAGTVPIDLCGKSMAQAMAAIRGGTPAPPLPDGDDASRTLNAIIARATARDPMKRYPSAASFADDLEAWVGGGCRAPRRSLRWAPVTAAILAAAVVTTAGAILVRDTWREPPDTSADSRIIEIEAAPASDALPAAAETFVHRPPANPTAGRNRARRSLDTRDPHPNEVAKVIESLTARLAEGGHPARAETVLRMRLADLHLALDQFVEAEHQLRTLLDLAWRDRPGNPEDMLVLLARARLGWSILKQDRAPEARAYFEAIIADVPTHLKNHNVVAYAQIGLARIFIEENRLDLAEPLLQQGIEVVRRDPGPTREISDTAQEVATAFAAAIADR